jgi:hypothetical protein
MHKTTRNSQFGSLKVIRSIISKEHTDSIHFAPQLQDKIWKDKLGPGIYDTDKADVKNARTKVLTLRFSLTDRSPITNKNLS